MPNIHIPRAETMGIQINIQAPDGWLRFNFSVSHPME